MVRNAIISTIGAVIVSAITYYFFTPRPVDPSKQLEIEYQDMMVARNVLLDAIGIALKGTNSISKEIVDNFHGKFDYYRDFTFANYTVSNIGSDVANNLELHLSDYIIGYSNEGDVWDKLSDNAKLKTFEILPGKKIQVLLVTAPRVGTSETFVSNGRNVPVREVIPRYNVPLSRFAQDYPFVIFALSVVGGMAVLLGVITFIITLAQRDDPSLKAHNAESSDMATTLALINWLRVENPEKYDRVVEQAERTHSKWLKARARSGDSQ